MAYQFSKTTLNFAEARNLEVIAEGYTTDKGLELVEVFEKGEDSEPLFYYSVKDGEFFYFGNVYLPKLIKEELPYNIKDEKEFRRMLDFVSRELNES